MKEIAAICGGESAVSPLALLVRVADNNPVPLATTGGIGFFVGGRMNRIAMKLLLSITERFLRHVEQVTESGCWIFNGTCSPKGYGMFYVSGGGVLAHRFSYELHIGHIDEGMQIDHLCRVRCCVNPYHLEAVTPRVNALRGYSCTANNSRKTHCKNGHLLAGDNLLFTVTKHHPNGRRRCRACMRNQSAKDRHVHNLSHLEAL